MILDGSVSVTTQRLLNRTHALASQMTVVDWICQMTQRFALPILGKKKEEKKKRKEKEKTKKRNKRAIE